MRYFANIQKDFQRKNIANFDTLHFITVDVYITRMAAIFAIASSLPSVTTRNLQIAMGFVGNYAIDRLSPQTYDMPVILKQRLERSSPRDATIIICSFYLSLFI
jgi:hypothetical protein